MVSHYDRMCDVFVDGRRQACMVHRLKWEVALHLMNITHALWMFKLVAFDPTITSLLNPITLLEVSVMAGQQ